MKQKKLCRTNKDALRWCKTRIAKIEFDNWRQKIGLPGIQSGITCMVIITKLKKGEITKITSLDAIDKTLLGAVNKWIKHLNVIKK